LNKDASHPILEVRNLTAKIKSNDAIITVVDGLSFALFPGQTLALVGESGCGKTLTALSIMRILPRHQSLQPSGEVIYRGENLLTLSEKQMRSIRGSKITMIFQDPMSALNPVYTIGNQLMEVAKLHLNMSEEEAWTRSCHLLDRVGISSSAERMESYPHQLSGGLRQRIMIAMALMCEPDILIADEPTTALDVTVQAQVLDLIQELQRESGMALLLITHDMGVVAKMADYVTVMYLAQSAEQCSSTELFYHPSHPYTIGLFQSRPSLETTGRLQPIAGSVPSFQEIPSGCRFHPRCPFVMEKCRHTQVPLFKIGQKAHYARCLLHDGTAESEIKLKSLK